MTGPVGLSWEMPEEDEDGQSVGTVVGFGTASGNARSNNDDNQEPAGPESYEVGYTVEGSEWSDGGSETVTDMAASISGLENGVTYAFRVRAMAGEETGPWSATVTATPQGEEEDAGPTVTLALADDVGTPASGAFGITVTFSEAVTDLALEDLTVAHGAASSLSGSDAAYTATITPNDGLSGDVTIDLVADAATDADGNGNTAAPTLTVAVETPVTKPGNVTPNTTASTAWKSMDLIFDAPPAGSDWVGSKSQLRVLGMKPGAKRTDWRSFKSTSVEDGRVHASTGRWLAIGRVYEVEVRWCGASSAVACSEASDMVYGASPASAPTNAEAAQADATDTLRLSWSISPIGGKKSLQASYQIGWSADTGASEPETLLDSADVPSFGTEEATVNALEAGAAYRLFVRSVIDWQGARLFASHWTSAVATTASQAEGLAQEARKRELARQARIMLEDGSAVIGARMAAGRAATR